MVKDKGLSKLSKAIITIGAVLAVLATFAGYFINEGRKQGDLDKYRESQKEVTFKDSEQKHDIIDLLTIDYHPFTVAKATDALGIQLKVVDTLLSNTLKQKIIDAEAKRIQDSIDNFNEIKVQENRVKKYKLLERVLDELILIKLDQRKMNVRLDSIIKN